MNREPGAQVVAKGEGKVQSSALMNVESSLPSPSFPHFLALHILSLIFSQD